MSESKDKVRQLADAWDFVMSEHFWHELSDDELHAIANLLWDLHLDGLNEWTRRKMVKDGSTLST